MREKWIIKIFYIDGEEHEYISLSPRSNDAIRLLWKIGEKLRDEVGCVKKLEIKKSGDE